MGEKVGLQKGACDAGKICVTVSQGRCIAGTTQHAHRGHGAQAEGGGGACAVYCQLGDQGEVAGLL